MKPDDVHIATHLQAHGYAMDVHAFETLGSTNDWLREQALSSGLCVTNRQRAGKGRRGRTWETFAGNITFSMVQDLPIPAPQLGCLSLVTGIACGETLRTHLDLDVRVKWPNDLILNGSKLGGLLHEAAAHGRYQRVVGGIGVNLVADERLAALGIGGTSLAEHGVSPDRRDELLAALAVAVLDAWKLYVDKGWAVFTERWSVVDAVFGETVCIFSGIADAQDSSSFDGEAAGVADDGALQVRVDGVIKKVHAGDVSVRRATQSK